MVNVASYFTDPDGDALTYAAASSNAAIASVAVSGSVVSVTAVARGMATVTVTARDPGGLATEQDFAVTVPNRAPATVGRIGDLDVHVDSVAQVDVAAYFTDPDGEDLEYRAASSDTNVVAVAVSESVVTVTGLAVGTVTVTVIAQDSAGLSAEQSFGVTVPNRPPQAVGTIADAEVHVDSLVAVDVAEYFSDPDGQELEYSAASSDTTRVTVSGSASEVTLAGVAAGGATVIVTATDPGGLSAEQTFTVTVPNRAPTITAEIPAAELFVGSSLSVDLAAHFGDPDGDTLGYAAEASAPAVAGLTMSGSELTITALTQGEAEVTATASDPEGLSARLTFAVTVPNRAPVAVGTVPAQAVFVGETGQVDAAAYFDDPDGDALTYSATSSNPAAVSATATGSVVSISAIATGTRATITVTATDPGGLSAQHGFTVTVPNRAPVAVGTVPAQAVFVGETGQVDIATNFDDLDGDALIYSAASSNPTAVSATMTGSVVSISAIATGTRATITVTATDPGGLSAQHGFTVTVPNRAPVAVGTVPAQAVFVGETGQVDIATNFDDLDGDALIYSAASSNPTAVSATMTGSVVSISAIATGTRATITVTATDPGGLSAQHSFAVTVPNRAPLPVGSLPSLTLAVGQTVTVDVATYFEDPDGDTLAYAAASADDDVATVTASGSVVTVVGHGQGTARVTVTATDPGGLSGQQSFDVALANQAPVVRDSIRARTLGVGETASWPGVDLFRDPDGDGLTYAAESSEPDVVRSWVSGTDLLIQARSGGAATVTFSAYDPQGLSARIVFTVTVLGPVAISGTDPVVLLEGATAMVFGSGFSDTPGLNQVSVGGLAARVTAASETALSITVPRADCLPPRQAELRVTVGSRSNARTVGVTPLRPGDLELPTAHYRYTHAGDGCLHLPGDASGGEYLIGVVSTSEAPYSLTPVSMTSIVGDPAVAADRPLVASSEPLRQAVGNVGSFSSTSPMTAPAPNERQTLLGQEIAEDGRDWERHAEVMERNQELVRRLGPMPASMARARQSQTFSASDTLTLFAGFDATCASRGQVRALVRRVGNHTVWLDDLDNPSGTFTDSELDYLDAFYGTNVSAVHEGYFGGLSDVDGNRRVMILMTKEANRNPYGWVWFGDLYSSDRCPTSNQAEIFFGLVPDPRGVYGQAWTKQQVLDRYPSLLTHEIAHLVQANADMFGGADFTTWELEGGATLSEQLVAYRLFGHGSGRNLGYAAFQQGRSWYSNWVTGLANFFGWDSDDLTNSRRVPNAPEECSWMGLAEDGNDGPCKNASRAIYDVPSMVLRYAMDRFGGQYPGGEQALMRHLTRSAKKGLASLAEVSRWSTEQILADFYISLWIDLNGGDAYGMATWDLDNIWNRFPESAQLRPWSSTSAEFHGQWNIRAGSTYYLRWVPRGSRGPTSLRVRSANGAPAPGHVSVWAFRAR